MQKTVVLPLQMCIARFSCFLQQAVTGYRSIYCTAVLNPFVFVTVSVFTFRPTERPDKTKDREERETSVICFKKYPHQESLRLFYLNAYDRGIPRVCFEASSSLFAIV